MLPPPLIFLPLKFEQDVITWSFLNKGEQRDTHTTIRMDEYHTFKRFGKMAIYTRNNDGISFYNVTRSDRDLINERIRNIMMRVDLLLLMATIRRETLTLRLCN